MTHGIHAMDGSRCRRLRAASTALAILVWLSGCGAWNPLAPPSTTGRPAILPPAQSYAGEVLAYFLQVVCGQTGPEPMRGQWQSRGAAFPLDYAAVRHIMETQAASKSDLLVPDPAVLGVARVLYHYNPRFNLFKGRSIFNSLYPSSELVALRLFLVRQLAAGTPIRIAPLEAYESLLLQPGALPPAEALTAMNMTADTFTFLQAIFHTEPQLLAYYTHPFIVDALVRMGVYAADARALTLQSQATYAGDASPATDARSDQAVVRVAVVPSLTVEFEWAPAATGSVADRLTPSAALSQQLDALIVSMRSVAESRLARDLAGPSSPVTFHRLDHRPRVIHPGNADRTVATLCPWADVVMVVLGQDVYRTMTLPDGSVGSDGRDLVFLDADDIRLGQMDDAISAAVDAIAHRLTPGGKG